MSERRCSIGESKRRERARLAALPIDEKMAILERLRDRAMAIAESPLCRERGTRAGRASTLRGDTGGRP